MVYLSSWFPSTHTNSVCTCAHIPSATTQPHSSLPSTSTQNSTVLSRLSTRIRPCLPQATFGGMAGRLGVRLDACQRSEESNRGLIFLGKVVTTSIVCSAISIFWYRYLPFRKGWASLPKFSEQELRKKESGFVSDYGLWLPLWDDLSVKDSSYLYRRDYAASRRYICTSKLRI